MLYNMTCFLQVKETAYAKCQVIVNYSKRSFVAIAMGRKLEHLDICINDITDDSSDVIASALEHSSLIQLRMDYNRISEDGAKSIVAALHFMTH